MCIILVRGENPDGDRIFAYVGIRGDKLPDFMAAQAAGTFYPEDFGIIIESDVGEPPAAVRERMTREFGVDHNNMVDIADAEAARRIVRQLRDTPVSPTQSSRVAARDA